MLLPQGLSPSNLVNVTLDNMSVEIEKKSGGIDIIKSVEHGHLAVTVDNNCTISQLQGSQLHSMCKRFTTLFSLANSDKQCSNYIWSLARII